MLNIGVGSVIEAELWGLYEGLKMAWNSGFRKVLIESDSLSSVQLICSDIRHNHPLYGLIQSCKNLVAAEWSCSITHIFREGNKLADGLARMGYNLDTGIKFYEDPPPEISLIFDADYRGITCLRQGPILPSS